ncbi:thiamine phosphate synthase [Ramlibacter alkalitolerans]|uniref:Thiamine phosphate synthase n=1 Tax=Ramlibacter alkalitolerans TaxID=2039631 RepID=A0ABS1JT63_9BURK|nr:thiamine phosphate synthase [Ramlibacter alkalitolerans]MBL0426765.1 thiamine phosphate synthase [Ramlibacter alkalitolerans]
MNDKELVVCTADEARERAGLAAQAPLLAQRLRDRGARAVCIVGARDGLDWIDTREARGWLAGTAQSAPAFASAMRQALAQGFVDADAAIVAKMTAPFVLPSLSWGESLPPSPPAGGSGRGHSRRLDLYAIVDSAARLRQVLAAGVRTVQLRIKKPASPDAAWQAMLRDEVQQAIAASTAHDAELFINDHWQLAQELGATGVHLGQEDLLALGEAGRARLLASGMALGVSSHSLWELARARTLAPRYIACGPVWPTVTKDMPWLPQGMDNLAWWCRAAQAPVTAIGGILEPRQVQEVARTGCDGVCIVRGLGDDPRASVPRFEAALQEGRAQPAVDAPQWPHPSLPRAADRAGSVA